MWRMYGKIRKNEKLPVGKSFAPGNDGVVFIGDITMALLGVEVSVIIGIAQKEDGDEANGGVGDKEGITKEK